MFAPYSSGLTASEYCHFGGPKGTQFHFGSDYFAGFEVPFQGSEKLKDG